MKKILLLILISGGFFFASISYAATYNITSQTDLEEMGSKGLTSANTFILQNDITVSNWTRINKTWAGATLDGNGYKISGITTRGPKFITANQTNSGVSFTSTNFGETHTISWLWGGNTGTGIVQLFGSYGGGNGIYVNGTTLYYRAGGGWGVQWSNITRPTTPTVMTLVRNGMSVTLYYGENNTGTLTMPASGKSMTIGDILTGVSGTWASQMSEIVITSDAKDSAWIKAQVNGDGPSGIGRYTTTANTTNLMALWHFDEGTGTTSSGSVGGLNLTGIDGWTTPVYKGGFIETATWIQIKNLVLDAPSVTWNLVDTATSYLNLGGVVSYISGTGGTSNISKVEIRGGTLSAPNVKYVDMAGFSGMAKNTNFYDCISSVDNFVWSKTTDYTPKVAGIVGAGGYGSYLYRCYFTGGATNAPGVGLLYRDQVSVDAQNSFVTGYTYYYAISGQGKVSSHATNYFYDRGKNASNEGANDLSVKKTSLSWFYDVSNLPMSGWDFTATGAWSPRLNTTAFPPLKTRFSGDISGSITGIGSGKTVFLDIPKTSGSTGNRANISTTATLASTLNLGTVHTIAFTASIDPGARRAILRDAATNYQVGFTSSYLYAYILAGTNYATGVSDASSHRYVYVRNGTSLVIYRDGISVFSSNSLPTTDMNGLTEAFRGTGAGSFIGTADEMIITSDAKNAAWVATDWNGGAIKYYRSDETNLLNLWHFEETSGTTAVDSKSGNTITFNSAPTWESTFLSVAPYYYKTLTASDAFTFTGVSAMYGKPLIIYVYGDAIKSSLVSTIIEGTGNITGIVMEQDTLVLGDTNLNPTVSYANVLELAPSATTDYCVRANSNILYYRDGCDVLVPTGCAYTGTQIIRDSGETGTITINGTLTAATKLISDTAINLNGTMPAGDVQVGGSTTCDVTVTSDCHLTSYGSDVVRDLTVTSPANCQCTAFTMKGDLTNTGTFYSSSLGLQGTTQTVTNSGTFSTGYFRIPEVLNLFGDMTIGYFLNYGADYLVTFEHGKTYSLGNFEDTGSSPGHELHFRSDTPGARYTIDNISGGVLNTSFIDVQDSNVSTNDFYATRSINSGNNDNRETAPHWVFGKSINAFLLQYK